MSGTGLSQSPHSRIVSEYNVGMAGRHNDLVSALFLDVKSCISARDEFEAEDDQRAIMIAGLLYDACSDRCTGFELWRGASRLLPPRNEQPAKPVCNLAELRLDLQTIVLEREEILANSHWLIAKSKRLQARIAELQGSPPATAGDGGP